MSPQTIEFDTKQSSGIEDEQRNKERVTAENNKIHWCEGREMVAPDHWV